MLLFMWSWLKQQIGIVKLFILFLFTLIIFKFCITNYWNNLHYGKHINYFQIQLRSYLRIIIWVCWQSKFTSLMLAFKTDKMTLDRRLELQLRLRDQAEQNMAAELNKLKAAVQVHVLQNLLPPLASAQGLFFLRAQRRQY